MHFNLREGREIDPQSRGSRLFSVAASENGSDSPCATSQPGVGYGARRQAKTFTADDHVDLVGYGSAPDETALMALFSGAVVLAAGAFGLWLS